MISSRSPKAPRVGEKRAVGEHWSEHPDDGVFDHGPWHKISEAVKNDHRQIEAYYNRMAQSDDPGYLEEYQNAFIWKLSRHSIAEEIVLYPNLERCVEKGNYIASQDRHEHYKVRGDGSGEDEVLTYRHDQQRQHTGSCIWSETCQK